MTPDRREKDNEAGDRGSPQEAGGAGAASAPEAVRTRGRDELLVSLYVRDNPRVSADENRVGALTNALACAIDLTIPELDNRGCRLASLQIWSGEPARSYSMPPSFDEDAWLNSR